MLCGRAGVFGAADAGVRRVAVQTLGKLPPEALAAHAAVLAAKLEHSDQYVRVAVVETTIVLVTLAHHRPNHPKLKQLRKMQQLKKDHLQMKVLKPKQPTRQPQPLKTAQPPQTQEMIYFLELCSTKKQ